MKQRWHRLSTQSSSRIPTDISHHRAVLFSYRTWRNLNPVFNNIHLTTWKSFFWLMRSAPLHHCPCLTLMSAHYRLNWKQKVRAESLDHARLLGCVSKVLRHEHTHTHTRILVQTNSSLPHSWRFEEAPSLTRHKYVCVRVCVELQLRKIVPTARVHVFMHHSVMFGTD